MSIGAAVDIYRGWSLYWTGWKSDQSNDRLVAQWVAYPVAPADDSPCFYASYPGRQGRFLPGDTFNTCPRYDTDTGEMQQDRVSCAMPLGSSARLLGYQRDTLERVKQEIDKYLAAKEEEE